MKSTTISPGVDNEIAIGFATCIAAQATGCSSAGSYLDFAKERGYTYVEVVNWSSSAGDWTFIVSKNGLEWHLLYQENNYPRPGFFHQIVEEVPFFGTAEEVLAEIYERGYA